MLPIDSDCSQSQSKKDLPWTIASLVFVCRSEAWVLTTSSFGKISLSSPSHGLSLILIPSFRNFLFSHIHSQLRRGCWVTKCVFQKMLISLLHPLLSHCPIPKSHMEVKVLEQILPSASKGRLQAISLIFLEFLRMMCAPQKKCTYGQAGVQSARGLSAACFF